MPATRTDLFAQLLDIHLARAIARHKDPDMSQKLRELAASMAARKKAWDARAEDLMAGLDKLDQRAGVAFGKHEQQLAAAEAGFRDMEDAVRDLEGANNPPSEEEASAGSPNTSFRAG